MMFVMIVMMLVGLTETRLLNHEFYGLEMTDDTAKAQSLKELNKCKEQCLKMKENFPLAFRVQSDKRSITD